MSRDLTLTQNILKTEHSLDFTATSMSGNWSVLVSETTDGTWVINDDFGICWYPGKTWHEDGSEPTRENYFDVEYDDETDEVSNVAEFATWIVAQIAIPNEAESDRNDRAGRQGHEDGARAYAEHGDQPHSAITLAAYNASTWAFTEGGDARAIYGSAYIEGWYTAYTARKEA